jgi:hypothetical protein
MARAIGGDLGESVRKIRVRAESLEETGDVPALLARDDESFELADKVGGVREPLAGHGLHYLRAGQS